MTEEDGIGSGIASYSQVEWGVQATTDVDTVRIVEHAIWSSAKVDERDI